MIVIRRRLFWKVYLTLLSSLVAVALLTGVFWGLIGGGPRERWEAVRTRLAELVIPERDSPPGAIAATLRRLGEEINADITVYGPGGTLIAAHGEPVALTANEGDEARMGPPRLMRLGLADGRIVLARLRPPGGEPALRILSIVLIVAGGVGLAAFPMTARLTRRLEGLRSGVEQWGEGALSMRVDESGADEVAVVARTFNAAAARVEALLTSQKALLANASHELRSPLARLRMATELWLDRPSDSIHAELLRNLAEVDQLVDEILLASRLGHAASSALQIESVDLLGLAAEEAVRVDAGVTGTPVEVDGDATLLRRLIRNLLENAAKHGSPPIHIGVTREESMARLTVSDAGRGIAASERELVFEPFYRPVGRSETAGGWGLGLSLVRQIAARHGGSVTCEGEPDGGSRFVVLLAMGKDRSGARLSTLRDSHQLKQTEMKLPYSG